MNWRFMFPAVVVTFVLSWVVFLIAQSTPVAVATVFFFWMLAEAFDRGVRS